MNQKWDEGFKQFNKAFELIGESIDDFFKHPPVGTKITEKVVDASEVMTIRLTSWKDRWKASWRLLTQGEISIRKKK